MKDPILRFAKRSDVADIVQLCAQHARYEKADYEAANKAEKLAKHLFAQSPSLYCLVVEQEGELIGYATYMKQFATWDADYYIYMDCLFMTEAARGFGIGEQLVNRIKEECRKLQCTHVQWQTPDFNERAITFYHRIGATSKSKERFFLEV